MAKIDVGTRLEERVLRTLYEGSACALDCATELFPYEQPEQHLGEIESLLYELAQHAYLDVRICADVAWFSLTPAGSERLAVLVE
jgi:hypothetical protein